MTARKLAAEEAVMLLPATLPRDRVLEAIRWLGISADLTNNLASVTFEPDRITFEVWAFGDGEPRRMTVEARVK